VTDPTEPHQIGLWDPYIQYSVDPDHELDWFWITGFKGPVLQGDRLWLSGVPEVTELDISDPTRPAYVRHFELPYESLSFYAGDAGGLAPNGPRLFFAALHRGIHVLDVASPSELRHAGKTDVPGSVKDVALTGDHLIAVGEEPLGFRVLDSRSLQSIRSIENLSATEVEIEGDTAYAVGSRGVTAVDVADPAMPVVRGAYDRALDWLLAQVSVHDDLMALTTGAAGLELVRLVEAESLPEPTAGPTLTPWPTRGTPTQSPGITPLPTRTPRTRTYSLYLPAAMVPTVRISTACTDSGGLSACVAEVPCPADEFGGGVGLELRLSRQSAGHLIYEQHPRSESAAPASSATTSPSFRCPTSGAQLPRGGSLFAGR
jgi:hypothetical protein